MRIQNARKTQNTKRTQSGFTRFSKILVNQSRSPQLRYHSSCIICLRNLKRRRRCFYCVSALCINRHYKKRRRRTFYMQKRLERSPTGSVVNCVKRPRVCTAPVKLVVARVHQCGSTTVIIKINSNSKTNQYVIHSRRNCPMLNISIRVKLEKRRPLPLPYIKLNSHPRHLFALLLCPCVCPDALEFFSRVIQHCCVIST